jgi:hypothetical protein
VAQNQPGGHASGNYDIQITAANDGSSRPFCAAFVLASNCFLKLDPEQETRFSSRGIFVSIPSRIATLRLFLT